MLEALDEVWRDERKGNKEGKKKCVSKKGETTKWNQVTVKTWQRQGIRVENMMIARNIWNRMWSGFLKGQIRGKAFRDKWVVLVQVFTACRRFRGVCHPTFNPVCHRDNFAMPLNEDDFYHTLPFVIPNKGFTKDVRRKMLPTVWLTQIPLRVWCMQIGCK